jgi:hypothetical protein
VSWAGWAQVPHAQVPTGDTVQVPGEEAEEVEGDRGLEAAGGLLWGTGVSQGSLCSGSECWTHLSPPTTGHSPSPQPPGGGAASGTGGGCGAWGLWAEQGVVRGQAWDTGDRQVVKAHPVYGQEPRTHTGLELGVDVMQCVKRLVQNVSQGWVSHIFQDVQCQGQLSLDGHGALLHLRRGVKEQAGEQVRKDGQEGAGK